MKEDVHKHKFNSRQLNDIRADVLNYINSTPCGTIENYNGKYTKYIDIIKERYPYFFHGREFIAPILEQKRMLMADIDQEIKDKGVNKVNPKLIYILNMYYNEATKDKNEVSIEGSSGTITFKLI